MFKNVLDKRRNWIYPAIRLERVQFTGETKNESRNCYLSTLSGNYDRLNRLGRTYAPQEWPDFSGRRLPRQRAAGRLGQSSAGGWFLPYQSWLCQPGSETRL